MGCNVGGLFGHLVHHGHEGELHDAVNAVASIDFSTSADGKINVFETTIRYLGGLLAAYDLVGDKILLEKAIQIGDMLYHSFDTPSHMPVLHWNITMAAREEEQLPEENNYVAELGSLSLEFTRLSQLTKDSKWFDAIQRITDLFEQQQYKTKLPGMWPAGEPQPNDEPGTPKKSLTPSTSQSRISRNGTQLRKLKGSGPDAHWRKYFSVDGLSYGRSPRRKCRCWRRRRWHLAAEFLTWQTHEPDTTDNHLD